MKITILTTIALILTLFTTTAYSSDLSLIIINKVEQKAGIFAIIGGDSKMAVDIAKNSKFLVFARGNSKKSISDAVALARDENLLGKKCYFSYGKLEKVPFPANYLDLLIIDSSVTIDNEEALRVISPNGKILIIENGQIKSEESKNFPKEWDNWEHWYHGAGNNTYSSDTVKWPYLSQWMGLPHEGSVPTIIFVSHGRNYTVTGPGLEPGGYLYSAEKYEYANTVIAKNVFNGEELWRYPLPKGYYTVRSCAVATKDIFYISVGDKIVCLDAITGKPVKDIKFKGMDGDLKWIAIENDIIFATAGNKDPLATIITSRYVQANEGGGKKIWGYGAKVGAYNLKTDKTVWVYDNVDEIDSRSVGLSNGKFIGYAPDAKIVCLDTSNGNVLWKKDDIEFIKTLKRAIWSKPYGNNILRAKAVDFLCSPKAIFLNPIFSDSLYALDPENGKILWSLTKKKLRAQFKFIEGDKLFIRDNTFDAMTGKVVGEGCSSAGCGPTNGSPYGFFGRFGIIFDRVTEKKISDRSYRSSCYQSSFVANGLLINPMYWCGCSYILRGHTALSAAGDFDFKTKATTADRLETGSKSSSTLRADENDWPVYKGNYKHSASAMVSVTTKVIKKWEIETHAMAATPAIAVGKYIFYGDSNGVVHCTENEEEKWNFTTGSKIFAAPTFDNGKIYVGSSDGYAYALDASSGALVWRFMAAPTERNIMVYGHLSNTWPVNTGILVKDGIAYFAAGIVDRDGTHVFALNAETGDLKWHNNSCGWVDADNRKGVSAQGYMTIQQNHLFMAGGNFISPAGFNLKTGALNLSKDQGLGTTTRRGTEMLAFGNEFLIAGGPLMYSPIAEINPQKTGKGKVVSIVKVRADGKVVSPEIELPASIYAPVWDGKIFIVENKTKKGSCLSAYKFGEVKELISTIVDEYSSKWKGGRTNFITSKAIKGGKPFLPEKKLWTLNTGAPLSMALTSNALVFVNALTNRKTSKATFTLTAISKDDGKEIWTQQLSDMPLYNAICVTRNGDIVVSTVDGKISCYGQ